MSTKEKPLVFSSGKKSFSFPPKIERDSANGPLWDVPILQASDFEGVGATVFHQESTQFLPHDWTNIWSIGDNAYLSAEFSVPESAWGTEIVLTFMWWNQVPTGPKVAWEWETSPGQVPIPTDAETRLPVSMVGNAEEKSS